MRTLLVALLLFCSGSTFLAAQSSEHWLEVRSAHFVVLTNSNEKQGRRIASQFEQMRSVFHLLMPNATADSGGPIIVLALKDRKSFQSIEPAAYLAKGQLTLAGLFLRTQDKNFILVRLDAEGEHPFATVYHEYTHLLMAKAVWVPLWLNEGIAEFFQNTDIHDKEVLLGQPSTDDILYLRQNRLIPLTTLLKVDYASPYYHEEQKGSVFYAESWALMHYLQVNDREQNTERVQNYARFLVQNEDPVTAAQHAFGDLNRLQGDLDGYVSHGDYKMFRMKTAVTVDESTFVVRQVPTAEANAVRAEVLVYDQRPKEAEALLEASLREDPNNAAAHETMGVLKYQAHDIEGARRWYGEAVKLDSKSYLAHYYYAAMSLQANDRDHDAEVEASLRSAMQLKPDFAPAYDALARFYATRDEKLDEAHLLTLQAVTLEPESIAYRINAANVLVQMKRLSNAEIVLNTAAKMAKTPMETMEIQVHLEQLAQYRAAVEGAQKAQSQVATQTAPIGQVTTSQITTGQTTAAQTTAGGKMVVFKKVDGKMVGTAAGARKYPEGDSMGARRMVSGTIRNVQCSDPAVIAFSVEQKGKTVALYNNNFYKVTFTTANYTPEGDIKPCTDIEGMSARVGYAEVTDAQVAGQAISIELSR